MAKHAKTAISPTREEDYPEWYQQVVKAGELAESSPVRGCMVIKPWGYGIWEEVQRSLDKRIKETGHLNAYFPLFIPLSFLQKEAEHVEGFAKECAVVTHHRLEEKDGTLVPAAPLEEPLIVRPTSETIIGDSFARWVQSYRDLPLLINQWANVVRWEMRPRVFLRTSEFLWQEGHTAHADAEEAMQEVQTMLGVYQELLEQVLAVPVIPGEKTKAERFPGAENTFTVEAMMQDRKALQAGTSHYLGQNFSRAANIQFLNQEGTHELAYTTSWGVSTRLIGGMIMTHGDDDGLRVPPRVAPTQVVIIPVIPKDEHRAGVMEAVDTLAARLKEQSYADVNIRVHIDGRDIRGGDKTWQWIKRGVPLRVEIGPRDLEENACMLSRRDQGPKDKEKMSVDALVSSVSALLSSVQQSLYDQALAYREEHCYDSIASFEELIEFFTPKNKEKPEIHGGFVRTHLIDDPALEAKLAEHKLTVRCMPLEKQSESGNCIVSGKETKSEVIIAKAY